MILFINDFKIGSLSVLLISVILGSIITLVTFRSSIKKLEPEIISAFAIFILLSPNIVRELFSGNYYGQALLSVPFATMCTPLLFKFFQRAHISTIFVFFLFSAHLKRVIFSSFFWSLILLNLSRGGFVTAAIAQLAIRGIKLWLLFLFLIIFLLIVFKSDMFIRALYFSLENESEMARINFITTVFQLMSNASPITFFFGLSSVNSLYTYPHNIFLELFLYGGLLQIIWFASIFIFSLFIFLRLWFRGDGVGKSFLFRFWVISFVPSLLSGDLFYNLFFIACSSIIVVRTLLKKNAFYNYNW